MYYPTPEKGGTNYSRSTFPAHAEPEAVENS